MSVGRLPDRQLGVVFSRRKCRQTWLCCRRRAKWQAHEYTSCVFLYISEVTVTATGCGGAQAIHIHTVRETSTEYIFHLEYIYNLNNHC